MTYFIYKTTPFNIMYINFSKSFFPHYLLYLLPYFRTANQTKFYKYKKKIRDEESKKKTGTPSNKWNLQLTFDKSLLIRSCLLDKAIAVYFVCVCVCVGVGMYAGKGKQPKGNPTNTDEKLRSLLFHICIRNCVHQLKLPIYFLYTKMIFYTTSAVFY